MRKNDIQLGTPAVQYTDTKANIEALTGIAEGAIAYATDTNKLGSYDGSAWTWGSGGGGGHTIQDEGTPLTARANLNFVGGGVTATDDAGNNATVVAVPAGISVADIGSTAETVGGAVDNGSAATASRSDHKHAITNPKLDDLATPDDNTDLNANTTNHGLLLKAVAPSANELNIVGIGNGETSYANKDLFNTTNPADLAGTAAPGTSVQAARSDHVHLGLTATQLTDLTDSGDSTLHYHAVDRYTHPNHSGDVTSVGDGAQTIAAGAVTLAKMANMATSSLIYRKTAGAGAPEVNSLATLKTDLGIGSLNLSTQATDTKEPTGWVDPANIIVSYDSTTQKITLTAVSGTLDYYWRGVKTSLASPWESTAHTNTVGHQYYLSSTDGTNFTWATDTVWAFDAIMVAFVNYQTAHKHAHVETHGLMQWQVHEELHETIGTYKESGGTLDPASYALASTTATDRRPNVVATHIHDEDIDLVLAALTSKSYNKFYLTSTSTINFTGETAEIISVTGSQPNYNLFTGGAWTQQAMTANTYTCVWLAAMPATADATSQTYRYIWIQGQSAGTLLSQQTLSPASINYGTLTTEAAEFVVLLKVIINYQSAGGGNWVINSVENISGTKFTQVASVAGSFLSTVATNGSLTGDGTLSSPLSASSGETTATAAGTTTLTVLSKTMQEFTGTTTQTVVLPVVTTLRLGHRFVVINNSTGIVTINSSGGNLVTTAAAGTTVTLFCILITGTTAASWTYQKSSANGSGSSIVTNEVPGGSVNSSNVSFTTAASYITGTLKLYLNGQRLKSGGVDFTETGSNTFTTVLAPITGDVLLVDYEVNIGSFVTGSASWIFAETPAGTINGSNKDFTLASMPVTGTLQLFSNGLLQSATGDYSIAGGTITFVTAPLTGSILKAWYQSAASTAGNADLLDGYHATDFMLATAPTGPDYDQLHAEIA